MGMVNPKSKLAYATRRASKRKHDDTAKRWRRLHYSQLVYDGNDHVLIDEELLVGGGIAGAVRELRERADALEEALSRPEVIAGYASPVVIPMRATQDSGNTSAGIASVPGNEAEELGQHLDPPVQEDNVVPIRPYQASPEELEPTMQGLRPKIGDPQLEGDFQRLAAAYSWDFYEVAEILGQEYAARDGHCRLTHGKQSYDDVRLERMIRMPSPGHAVFTAEYKDGVTLSYWDIADTGYCKASESGSRFRLWVKAVEAQHTDARSNRISYAEKVARGFISKRSKRRAMRAKADLKFRQGAWKFGFRNSNMEQIAGPVENQNPSVLTKHKRTSIGQLRKIGLAVRDFGDWLRLATVGKTPDRRAQARALASAVDEAMHTTAKKKEKRELSEEYQRLRAWKSFYLALYGREAWKRALADRQSVRLADYFSKEERPPYEDAADNRPPPKRGERPISGAQVRRYLRTTGAGH